MDFAILCHSDAHHCIAHDSTANGAQQSMADLNLCSSSGVVHMCLFYM